MGETSSAEPAGRRIRGLDADQRRAGRRRALLDAALSLFAGQGYASTAIEQICQTAYVGTKGFYELFDSKEACYLELLDQISDEIMQKLVTALASAPADERRATRALISAFAHALVDDPRKVEAAFGQGAGISPAVDARRRANRRWAAGFLESVWHRYGVGTGPAGTPGIDLHTAAVGCIGGLFDLVVEWLVDHGRDAEPARVETLVAKLVAYYELVRAGLGNP